MLLVIPPKSLDRFWRKVVKTDSCWNWIAGCSQGYGMFGREGAHRVSYKIHKGEIPQGLMALHTCDNRKCVNPDHIYLGDHQDNSNDMVARNRQAKGEAVSRGVLTEALVRKIRAMSSSGKSSRKIAKAIEVSQSAVTQVISGKTWSWVS